MKTLTTIQRTDERNAKIVGFIINSLLSLAGLVSIIYGVIYWAPKVF